jgi:hypothetical protein
MRKLLILLLVLVPTMVWATGVDILVLTNGDQIEMEDGPTHGFIRLPQGAGTIAAECNEAGESGQVFYNTGGAVGAKLAVCTGTAWEAVGLGASTGDQVFENTTALTDADFTDSTRVSWNSTPGAPYQIAADVIADSVEDNQDLLDFQNGSANDCNATEAADGSYLRRDTLDTTFECVQHWRTFNHTWVISNAPVTTITNAPALLQNLQTEHMGKQWTANTFGTRIPIGSSNINMEGYQNFPDAKDVILDELICCMEGDGLVAGNTVGLVPFWRRWGNGSGGTTNGAATLTITVTSPGSVTTGRQNCAEVTYNNLTPYGTQKSALAIQFAAATLDAGADDISIDCTGYLRVSEN